MHTPSDFRDSLTDQIQTFLCSSFSILSSVLPLLILAHPSFIKQSRNLPNVVSTVVHGLQQLPLATASAIPAPALAHSAKTSNCWHVVIRMFEDRLTSELPSPSEQVFVNLYSMYRYDLSPFFP